MNSRRWLYSFFLAFLSLSTGYGQNREIAQLRKQLATEKNPVRYIDAYNQLGFLLHINSADSTFLYGLHGLELARRQHYSAGEAQACSNLGAGLMLKGLYSEALGNYARSYDLYAEMRDTTNMMQSLMNQAVAYDYMNNDRKRADFSRRALALAARFPRDSVTSMIYANYAALNAGLSADSVRRLLQQAATLADRFHDTRVLIAVDQVRADRLLGQQQYPAAKAVIDRILLSASRNSWDYHYLEGLGLLARYYQALGQTDSVIAVNLRIYRMAEKNHYSFWETEVLHGLVAAYDARHEDTRSLAYHRLLVKALEDRVAGNDRFIGDYLKFTAAQRTIGVLENANDAKSSRIRLLAGFSLLTVVLLLVLVWQYRRASRGARQLAESDRFKSRLLSVVAHDFRAPLSSTLGMIELLQDDTLPPDEARGLFAGLEQDIHQVLLTFDNLLAWIKEQSAGYHLKAQEVRLADAWTDVSHFFSRQISAAQLNIWIDIPSQLVLATDREILQFVNRNLLHNAIKHSPKNGTVYIRAVVAQGMLTVSVRDEGPGMSAERIGKLFRFQDPAGGAIGGAGMAMTIARELLEKSGGKIWAESVAGQGATFFYRLPT